MDYENQIVKGFRKESYVVANQVGKGGEGLVYNSVIGRDKLIKIYKEERISKSPEVEHQLRKKIELMVTKKLPSLNDQNKVAIAWPSDAIYDKDTGRFIGFVMPKLPETTKIFDVCRERQRLQMFPNYNWKYAIGVAYNLAWTVAAVHECGCVVGDMNPNNIIVDKAGAVTLIDTDSFDIFDDQNGIHYKCSVGVGEFLAPELQGRNLASDRAKFTKNTDNFSLAIHIFNLLMNNAHPFNCTNLDQSRSSTSNEGTCQSIAEGRFFHGKNKANIQLPLSAPDYNILPDYIKNAFNRTFCYDSNTAVSNAPNRTTAQEWRELLHKMFYEEKYDTCNKNAHHLYLRGTKGCPWCAVEKKVNSVNK